MELEHIESSTGRLLGSTVTSGSSSLKAKFKVGDTLFGKLRAYLRKFWRADRRGVCSTEIWVLRAKPDVVDPEYLFQLIQTDGFVETASVSYGTHMPRSDWNVVRDFELLLPTITRQRAVASLLADMDAELAALEARLTKTRALKQGMLQQLLTGRVRLMPPKATAPAKAAVASS